MRFWIVGGGTGGHIYPALAAAQALQAIEPSAMLTWVGGAGGMEAQLIAREGIPFVGIPAGGMHGVGPVQAIKNGVRLLQGMVAAWRHLGQERPAAILTTGGYVSGPVALAAKLRRVPVMVFLPDIEPALSVKFVSRLAVRIATTVADSHAFLPAHKITVTGYPLREDLRSWDRASAREAFGIPQGDRMLLAFGGSRGARSINRAILAHLPELLREASLIHISGTLDWDEVSAAKAALPGDLQGRYYLFPYLHEKMGAALAAADLVISRAGASILGEFPYFGLPAILVPYPYAWRYQKVNAEWLAKRGAAVVVADAELPEKLVSLVRELWSDERQRLQMGEAARSLAHPTAAQELAELLFALGEKGR